MCKTHTANTGSNTTQNTPDPRVGIVTVARNEGERFRTCLQSLSEYLDRVVYVDSGSSDGSVEYARSLGVSVVELDPSTPFRVSRARNEGFERLMEEHPDTDFVLFLDGDCEVHKGWIGHALRLMEEMPGTGAIGGRRRERFPENSIYNRLADIEWNNFTPGEIEATGGDMLVRVKAVRDVGGFDAELMAGEDPEFCFRLRRAGWKIYRTDEQITTHDAAMMHFGQWWRRTFRAGHGYAECAWKHRGDPGNPEHRKTRSSWAYGLVLPALIIVSAPFTFGLSLLALGIYPLLAFRLYRGMRKKNRSREDSWIYALFVTTAKFPHMLGQCKFHRDRLLGKKSFIIEYKED